MQQIVVNQAGYYGVEHKEAVKRSELYLKQLDLWEKRNERARMLSGGMKRRLMIARALMHEPKLLIWMNQRRVSTLNCVVQCGAF